MATFVKIPHIGEKVFGFLTTREDFKNCSLVCKNWNSILKNPTFWMNKLKKLDQPTEKWQTLILKLKDCNLALKELAKNLREEFFVALKEPYLCVTCERRFDRLIFLKDHQKFKLCNFKLWCYSCVVSFLNERYLQQHKNSPMHNFRENAFPVFSHPTPFYCEDCDIGFETHEPFANHLNSKIHFSKCGNEVTLNIYIRNVMECLTNFKFNMIQTMDHFIEKYEITSKNWFCEVCEVGFSYQELSVKHMRSNDHFIKCFESLKT